MTRRFFPFAITGLIIAAAVSGLAGIDLVLPAIPQLPELFNTNTTKAQLVLAFYVAGTVIGLIVYGSLASRIAPFRLLLVSLIGFALTSFIAAYAPSIDSLLVIRFIQGFTAIAPAVLAAGIIRSLYSETGAMRAIGLMGSIESLSPALAPIAGAAILPFGWNASFYATALVAAFLGVFTLPLAFKGGPAALRLDRAGGSVTYRELIVHAPFMRYAGTHAFLLGGLLVFVFAGPTVIVRSMGGALDDFILMQVCGVSCYIIASNTTTSLAMRFGKERMMVVGSTLAIIGTSGLTLFAWFGGTEPIWLIPLFLPLNIGLGFLGPIAFLSAVQGGKGDDARASALIFLMITITSSSLTGLVALIIDNGLKAPATVAFLSILLSAFFLHGLKRKAEQVTQML